MAKISMYTVVTLVTVLALCDVTFGTTNRVFGIKLCRNLCLKTAGCWNYIFITSDHSCDVSGKANLKLRHGIYTFNVTKTGQEKNSCARNSKIIKKRNGQVKCLKMYTDSSSRSMEPEKQMILFLLFKAFTNTLHGYYPLSRSVKTWKLDKKDRYYQMIYMYPAEVALYPLNRKLKVFKLDSEQTSIMEKPLHILDMTPCKNCIFIITGHGKGRTLGIVDRKDRQFSGYTKLYSFKAVGCTKIEYNNSTSCLYVLCGTSMRQIAFKTLKENVLNGKFFSNFMALDSGHNKIYLSLRSRLQVFDLGSGLTENITYMNFKIFQLSYCQGSLFLTSTIKNGIVYEYSNNVTIGITNSGKHNVLITRHH